MTKLLILTFAAIILLVVTVFTQTLYPNLNNRPVSNNQVLAIQPQYDILGFPEHLIIPSIDVDAQVEHVGLTQTGEMDVPSSTDKVGWFRLGPRPGEIGSAVIGGHLNGKSGDEGVFVNLHKLKKDDMLYIQDDKGTLTAFVVRDRRTYNPGYADEVFSRNDSAHLNLITCDGLWDETKQSYSKRLVVFADIAS